MKHYSIKINDLQAPFVEELLKRLNINYVEVLSPKPGRHDMTPDKKDEMNNLRLVINRIDRKRAGF